MNRTPSSPSYSTECAQYLRLSNAFTIEQAAVLWCGGDPGQDVALLRAAAPCFTIKYDLILQAVLSGRLPITRDGDGRLINASTENVARDRMRIMRANLVAWFEQLPTKDRPAFLFDDDAAELPDIGEVATMNADRAIAVMALLLSENRSAMRIGARPNAAAIGSAVDDLARRLFGEDVRGFQSFNKRVSQALKTLEANTASGSKPWHRK